MEDVSAASLALHGQNFASATENNVVPKFTNKLSCTLHKICKYKAFLQAKFRHIWTESKDTYGKIHIREFITHIFACFTQSDVFHLLAQKRVHIIEQE